MTAQPKGPQKTTINTDGLPTTEIEVLIQQAIEKYGLSIRDLSDLTGTTYEASRRFVKGMNIPGTPILKILSQHFDWDFKAVKEMAIRDRQRIKYGEEYKPPTIWTQKPSVSCIPGPC